jgi:hypothetical protein
MGVLFQKHVSYSVGAFYYMYVSYKNGDMSHRCISNIIGVCANTYVD